MNLKFSWNLRFLLSNIFMVYALFHSAEAPCASVSYTFEYNAIDQLAKLTESDRQRDTIVRIFTYDANGSLIIVTNNNSNDLKKYGYNEMCQLSSYSDNSGTDVYYDYNAENLRSGKRHNEADRISYYYNSNGDIVNERQGAELTAYLMYSWRILRAVGKTASFYVNNTRDIVGAINSQGEMNQVYAYNSYGKSVGFTGQNQSKAGVLTGSQTFTLARNPFTYSSYYLDEESNMYYLKARYYCAELMRFISSDTYDISNKYAYGGGNPVSNSDPSGHWSQSATRAVTSSTFLFAGIVSGNVGVTLCGLIQGIGAGLTLAGESYENDSLKQAGVAVFGASLSASIPAGIIEAYKSSGKVGRIVLGSRKPGLFRGKHAIRIGEGSQAQINIESNAENRRGLDLYKLNRDNARDLAERKYDFDKEGTAEIWWKDLHSLMRGNNEVLSEEEGAVVFAARPYFMKISGEDFNKSYSPTKQKRFLARNNYEFDNYSSEGEQCIDGEVEKIIEEGSKYLKGIEKFDNKMCNKALNKIELRFGQDFFVYNDAAHAFTSFSTAYIKLYEYKNAMERSLSSQ